MYFKGLIFFILIFFISVLSGATNKLNFKLDQKNYNLNILTNDNPYTTVVLNAFIKKYPAVKINRKIYRAPGFDFDFNGAFTTSDTNKLIDVFIAGQSIRVNSWLESNYLADLTHLKNWPRRPEFYENHKKLIYFLPTPHGIIYNYKTVKKSDLPRKFDDILDKKWFGKVGIRHPMSGSTPQYFIHYINQSRGDLNYFSKLASNNTAVYRNASMLFSDVNSGKLSLAFARDMDLINSTKHRPFKNLKFLLMNDNVLFHYQMAGMNVKSKNTYAAELFLNWLLVDGEKVLEKNGYLANQSRNKLVKQSNVWRLDYKSVTANHNQLVHEAMEKLQLDSVSLVDRIIYPIFMNRGRYQFKTDLENYKNSD